MSTNKTHDKHMWNVANNPGYAGVNPQIISYTLVEVVWTPEANKERYCLADIIWGSPETLTAYICEIKKSKKHRSHAIEQLLHTQDFVEGTLNYPNTDLRIVYYAGHKGYGVENVSSKS